MRLSILARATSLVLATSCSAQPTLPSYIAAAVADPSRIEMRARDEARKPSEILAFCEIKPGDKVADLIPGGGYFTGLFSLVAGPKGHVYSIWPQEYLDFEGISVTSGSDPRFSNVTVLIEPAAAFAAPEALDLVFTSQNYHDYPDPLMGPTDPNILNKAVFAALKPRGVFLVIDHAAAAGSGLRDTDTLHRIDPAVVKAQVTAAGFVYERESKALANPADPRTALVFDTSIRGHTDQFAYKFRKPR